MLTKANLSLQTYDYAMMEEGPGGGTLWMVQQMCNHGTLIEAGKRQRGGAEHWTVRGGSLLCNRHGM